MTTGAGGRSDRHGPIFIGVYVRLLVRYLRLDAADLVRSWLDEGIELAPDARPVLLDA